MTKTKITPTVGRHVHFFIKTGADAQAAIITHVHNEGILNLGIFEASGKPMAGPPTSIPLVQPGEEDPKQGFFCKWMPYQAEQAEAEQGGDDETGSGAEPVSDGGTEGGAGDAAGDGGKPTPTDEEPRSSEPDTAGQQGGKHSKPKTGNDPVPAGS